MLNSPVRWFFSGALLLAGLAGGGCASIVHGGDRTVTVRSAPPGARVSVRTLEGSVVATATTPCTVRLDPKRGYFKGQNYLVRLELAGYTPFELPLQPQVSGWYFGNILLGGVIGMVAVDPVTGSMWNLQPDKLDIRLVAAEPAPPPAPP
jgi:hypothetical protein